MDNRYIVYALVDPATNEIRYIGKSSVGIARAKSHFEPKRISTDSNLHKARWLQGLQTKGLAPSVRILQVRDSDSALLLAERDWISFGRRQGWPLTNLTDGGDGAAGYHPSDTTRAKMSLAHKGKRKSTEVRAKISASRKGKPRPDVGMRNKTQLQRLAVSKGSLGRPRPDVAARNAGNQYGSRVRTQEERDRIAEGQRRAHARRKSFLQP
jgi:hypothetical protein